MEKDHPSLKTTILGVDTANPANSLTQQEVLGLVIDKIKPSDRGLDLYKTFLLDKGINRRYFSWDDMDSFLHESVDERMKRYERWSVELALDAAQKVLKKCRYQAKDIDALFVSTCTGYLCPGVSTYVSQKLGLPENIYTLDLVGLGCAGALPALRAAEDYLSRRPGSAVLVVAVEICSAAVNWAQKPELILSNSLFSDGSAAVLLVNAPKAPGLKVKNISSLLWPQFRDHLRFRYLDSGLCNVISPQVPDIAARAISALWDDTPDGRVHYAFHSAGRKVLDAIQERLGLSPKQMRPSRDILRDFGNMSSPSVLFVLKDILAGSLRDNDTVICFSFGAGFSASVLEAQWQSG
jgi:predicted naringenin-chalcone synthase